MSSADGADRPALPVGRASLLATRLPPLNLFRSFEAAAWHSSFTLAADELNVTQSAVSQQVRQLEEFLGMRLFHRSPRRLQLTPEGAIFASSIRESLGMIGRACARLRDPGMPTLLNVDVYPSFGARWLGRKLLDFSNEYPEIKVTLLASKEQPQFARQSTDIAVRWGNGHWPGAHSVSLGPQMILPVCSPDYLASHPRISSALDLSRHKLLQTLEGNHWAAWFEAAGQGGIAFEQGAYFGDAVMMLEACIEGHGIGLASHFLIERDLRVGKLVPAIDFAIEIGEGFHVLWGATLGERPSVIAFRNWLTAASQESVAAIKRELKIALPF